MKANSATADVRTAHDWHVSVCDDLRSVGESEWDALLGPGDFYSSHKWLRVAEVHDTFRARYVVVRDKDGRLLAGLPFYTTDEAPPDKPYDPYLALEIESLRPDIPRDSPYPAVLLGGRAGYTTRIPVAPDLDEATRADAVRCLVHACREAVSDTARSFSLLYTDTSTAQALSSVAAPSATPQLAAGDTVLPVAWDSFDAYLDTLSSSRRRAVRKDLAAFEASGLVVENGSLSRDYSRMATLLANLNRRYGANSSERRLRAHIGRQAEVFGDEPLCLTIRQDSEITGFSLLYSWKDELYFRIVGFDYDRIPEEAGAYFTLAFYEPIRHAIRNGVKAIRFSLETSDAKVRRGAILEPRFSMMSFPDGVVRSEDARRRNSEQLAELESRFGGVQGALPLPYWERTSWRGVGLL